MPLLLLLMFLLPAVVPPVLPGASAPAASLLTVPAASLLTVPAASLLTAGSRGGPRAGREGFVWPVVPARVVRRFDPPPLPWLPGHRGVDLAALPSATVRAAGAGTVVYAAVLAGRGVVSIAHPGGLRTSYEPVTPTVAVGDAVAAGGPVGTLEPGHPGCPEAACLHWGLRRGDLYLDPLALLGLGRVRLLPLSGPSP